MFHCRLGLGSPPLGCRRLAPSDPESPRRLSLTLSADTTTTSASSKRHRATLTRAGRRNTTRLPQVTPRRHSLQCCRIHFDYIHTSPLHTLEVTRKRANPLRRCTSTLFAVVCICARICSSIACAQASCMCADNVALATTRTDAGSPAEVCRLQPHKPLTYPIISS